MTDHIVDDIEIPQKAQSKKTDIKIADLENDLALNTAREEVKDGMKQVKDPIDLDNLSISGLSLDSAKVGDNQKAQAHVIDPS